MARVAIATLLMLAAACTARTSSKEQPETAGDQSSESPHDDAGAQLDTGTSMMNEPEPMMSSGDGDGDVVVVHPSMQDASTSLPVSDAGPAQDATTSTDASQTGDRIELSDLRLFFTPTNSIRIGAWGYDAAHGLCISVTWYIDSTAETRFCSPRLELLQPYVLIKPMADPGPTNDPKWDTYSPPCWDYATELELHAQRGCADFGELTDDTDDHIDIELDVTSDDFTGTLSFDY